MEIKESIYGRRSIRKYKPDPVPEEILREIMDDAVMAPSGTNSQPWFFVVLQEKAAMDTLRDMLDRHAAGYENYLKSRFPDKPEVVKQTKSFLQTLGGAPAAVLAFVGRPDYNNTHTTLVQSVAAAIENLTLSAYSHGVGTCWMTAVTRLGIEEELRDTFAPGTGEFIALIALGYPDQEMKAPRRRDNRVKFIL